MTTFYWVTFITLHYFILVCTCDKERIFQLATFDVLAEYSELLPLENFELNEREKRSVDNVEANNDFQRGISDDYSNDNVTVANHSSVNNPVECVYTVLEEMHKKIKAQVPEFRNPNKDSFLKSKRASGTVGRTTSTFLDKFDVGQFEKFCSIYNESVSRLNVCSNSTILRFALQSLEIIDFMCTERYSDFLEYLPCLQNATIDSNQFCKPNCSESEPVEDYSNFTISNRTTTFNISVILNSFDNDCRYTECFLHCQSPIVENMCGKGAKLLIQDGIHKIFGSLSGILNNLRRSAFWPDSCHRLAEIRLD